MSEIVSAPARLLLGGLTSGEGHASGLEFGSIRLMLGA